MMPLQMRTIAWGDSEIRYELRRHNRRKLRIDVSPSGQVVVVAPVDASEEDISARLRKRAPWVVGVLGDIAARPRPTPERRFVSGETHLYLGKQYRLAVEHGAEREVRIDGGRMVVVQSETDGVDRIRRQMFAFYRIQARAEFPRRLLAMLPAFEQRGLKRPKLLIRPLIKRWGSYTEKSRLVLNEDLIRASRELIDYVVCHELAHGLFPDHGVDWSRALNEVMPDWRERKSRLEALLR
jgi:predicted metal-dependent hydrolase